METKITKQISLSLIIIILSLFTATFNGFAQENNLPEQILQDRDAAIRVAYRNLNGIGILLDYRKAYYIFHVLAENGDAEAMNAIGMMYKQGLGFKQNDEKALIHFQKAAEKGYAKAAYNIALAYKYGHGVKQDYARHIEWLEKANRMGYENMEYLTGYAYYKGLGKQQSYQTAFQYFEKGAQKGDAASMYMLSLCYFRGRGVARDAEQGKLWMEKAADKGISRAVDIMARNDSKTYGEKKARLRSGRNNTVYEMIPLKHSRIVNDKNMAHRDLSGKWEGSIVQYDWSGEEIEQESKLEVTFNQTGNTIDGLWVENDTVFVRINALLNDSTWIFDNVTLYENQRPLDMKDGSFRLVNQNGKEYLIGNVSFYSESIREYTAPNYIVLEHKSNHATGISPLLKDNRIIVAPNPFKDKITVQINLDRPQKIRIVLYDLSGKKLETGELLDCGKGTQVTEMYVGDYPKGSYILKVAGESVNQSFTVVK
ncbi:MAG: T9SS type A sorting domain-containing protein [Dysgonamonadaceae bacterium]|jgi:TPR repeat protein|nr:T9SS type A sorting domain-containing protein [Dysgonamonadaceae bacterium]